VNQLYSAYVGTIFAPNNGNGWRSVQIERLGAVEVRPIEFAETQSAKELGICIELYDHGSQSWLTAFAAKVSTRRSCFSSNLCVRRNA
jgi:hypothetical protein